MNGGKIKLVALLAVSALMLFCAGNALAKAKGPCVNCHTMHNSQNGDIMRVDDSTGPTPALIKAGSCYGCHGDTNIVNGTWALDDPEAPGRTPRINAQDYGVNGTTGDTLAGGTFYWVDVKDADAKGHNVVGVASMDAALGYDPPGFNASFTGNGQLNGGNAVWNTQLTCAGTNGCHGDHAATDDFTAIRGGHHSGSDGLATGADVANSYRFLKGIKGIEDSDWEYQPDATNHNQYYGDARTADTADDTQTISYLCAECHGDFHSGTGQKDGVELGADVGATFGAAWLRHPTDLDMNALSDTSEYASYNGAGNEYSPIAPVASDTLTAVKTVVLQAPGDAIVTCLSCHRAHGSAYDDLLRWEYNDNGVEHQMSAANGAGNVGCFICHTTKDDI